MKELFDLISDDSAWPTIEEWLSQAKRPVDVLKSNCKNSEKILYDLQVTTWSILGAVVYFTGGIIIDNGWLRILGSGCDVFERNLSSWNRIDPYGKFTRLEGSMLIADDILGGFFAVNGGAFEGKIGDVYYFAPDSMKWESTNLTYPQFLYWAITGDVNLFYEMFRWDGWEKEVEDVSYEQGILFYPHLCEGEDAITYRKRKVVSIHELWNLNINKHKNLQPNDMYLN